MRFGCLDFESRVLGLRISDFGEVSLFGFRVQVGECALSILHSLVAMQADRDASGELLTPTPRVKRILATQRCLPHIAQVTRLGPPAGRGSPPSTRPHLF